MNLKDALKSVIKPHTEDVLAPLTTKWGETLDPEHLLSEYPRPQMQRDSYLSLNGWWDYRIAKDAAFLPEYDGRILVPFSPEASLSGVNRQLQPDEFLWYRRFLPDGFFDPDSGSRLILHFGAVDYFAELFVNGQPVTSHLGGYLPFESDITDYLQTSQNEIVLKVQDLTDVKSQARGKQTLKRGGIFYTAQSGIWQSVWAEAVSPSHITNIWFETDYDTARVTAHISACCLGALPDLELTVSAGGHEITRQSVQLTPEAGSPDERSMTGKAMASPASVHLSFSIPEEFFFSWSPETPFLYDAALSFGGDHIKSYFALRIFSIEKQDSSGIPLFCLNHRPCFLMGVLDQGYWPDGLYTAPSDEALIYDISAMKALGFNMLRKHIKIESARWYYHCDRLGMIVCQDMVNGGSRYHMPVISYFPTLFPSLSAHLKDSHYAMLSRRDLEARKQWEAECAEAVEHLKFFPSIAMWVPFNEGWGQFDTARITDLFRSWDPSRLIDSASGWFDQNCGDFISMHNYFRPLSVPIKKWGSRAFFLSEYGGFALHIKEHSSASRIFGYKRYETREEFIAAWRDLMEKSLFPLREQGLCGAVFTQLSDVEEEVNGILTYDRKINKLSVQRSL